MESRVFGLLDAKPYRTMMKLPPKVIFDPETCEIGPKVGLQSCPDLLLRLGEPSGGNWGNPGGPPTVTAL